MNTNILHKLFFHFLVALCALYFLIQSLLSDKFIRNTLAFGLSVIVALLVVNKLLSVHEYEQAQQLIRIQTQQ